MNRSSSTPHPSKMKQERRIVGAGPMTWRPGIVAVLCCASIGAYAQEKPAERFCTDLSGKVRVTCPGDSSRIATSPESNLTVTAVTPKSIPVRHIATESLAPGGSDESASSPGLVEKAGGRASSSWAGAYLRGFAADQKSLWSSPLKLRVNDAAWLVPLAGAITLVATTDTTIERKLPSGSNFIRQSKALSNYGAAAFGGAIAAGYLWGGATHNDHLKETAILSGEAAVDSLAVSEGFKYIAGRNRPLESDGTGQFRNGGSSFPSTHSAAAWSIAEVIAQEYPGPLTKLLAYGGAAAVSASRVAGRQHFASDVLVGSAIGWFIGRELYKSHSQSGFADSAYGSFVREPRAEQPIEAAHMGSPSVPLDSWVYPVLDRLAAWGYIHSALFGMRPWTRMECARLTEEAGEALQSAASDSDAHSLYEALRAEFTPELWSAGSGENRGGRLESVYTRIQTISGLPLGDAYHFGQTVVNDYGRPYGEGANLITGMSGSTEYGPFAVYVRGELQRGATPFSYSAATTAAIADADGISTSDVAQRAGVFRARLMDAYLALNIKGYQLSFGNQSLWWGPGEFSAMSMSSNAPPILMLRLSRSEPFRMPGPLSWMGPVRTELFLGRLNGHDIIGADVPLSTGEMAYRELTGNLRQPYIHGEKISFKPTPNMEFGFSSTSVFSGEGIPLTWHTLARSYSISNTAPGIKDPGDRRTGFDFRYALPGVRNLVTFYTDSMCEDEFSPIAYPRRCGWSPGIYLRRLPWLPKVDFRAEGGYTDLPNLRGNGIYYYNSHYPNGYTNFGDLIGSWIGREGRSISVASTYWSTVRDKVEVGFRRQHVNPNFVQGGELTDFSVQVVHDLRPDMNLSAAFQVEHWRFPAISAVSKNNATVNLQFTYSPAWGWK